MSATLSEASEQYVTLFSCIVGVGAVKTTQTVANPVMASVLITAAWAKMMTYTAFSRGINTQS